MSGFDPFGLVSRLIPEHSLHLLIKLFLALFCAVFLVMRFLEYGDFLLKPLWAVETAVYAVALAAFIRRRDPVDRAKGAVEIFLPAAGALLPFALLLTPPAPYVLARGWLLLAIFWWMTFSTLLTVVSFLYLGRSFSITPEARELVTGGPFRYIRHPAYLGEMLSASAVAAWRFSAANLLALAFFFALQLARARLEERKLAANFPEYPETVGKSWWFTRAARPDFPSTPR